MNINLTELFEVQRKLDAEIEKKHPTAPGEDRLAKRILALQVELGECANEWRGFKFWSTNQKAQTEVRESIVGTDETGTPYDSYEIKNPLLEEYVDCLHFILSIGLHLEITENLMLGETQRGMSIEEKFMEVFFYALECRLDKSHSIKYYFEELMDNFIDLGKMLGFTWEQVTDAYMKKNKTNWERQANGY